MDRAARSHKRDEDDSRALAIDLMLDALSILDVHGPMVAAATLSSAIQQAGGDAPEPGLAR